MQMQIKILKITTLKHPVLLCFMYSFVYLFFSHFRFHAILAYSCALLAYLPQIPVTTATREAYYAASYFDLLRHAADCPVPNPTRIRPTGASQLQEAQLPQRDSASATHVFLGSLIDRAFH